MRLSHGSLLDMELLKKMSPSISGMKKANKGQMIHNHWGNDFCPLIGGIRLLESLIFLTFFGLGRGTLKVLSF